MAANPNYVTLKDEDQKVASAAIELVKDEKELLRIFGVSRHVLEKAGRGLSIRDSTLVSFRISQRALCFKCKTARGLTPKEVVSAQPDVTCQACLSKPMPVYERTERVRWAPGGGGSCNITFATKKRKPN